MKKLMIAACAVAFATSVQAASILWCNYNDMVDQESGEVLQTLPTGYELALVCLGSTETYTGLTASNIRQTSGLEFDGEINVFQGSYSLDAGTGDANNYYYAVMLKDADGNLSQLKYADGGSPIEAFQVDGWTSDDWSGQFDVGTEGSFYGTFSSVPEPTSGLLLLLGVAGLALRRRRA